MRASALWSYRHACPATYGICAPLPVAHVCRGMSIGRVPFACLPRAPPASHPQPRTPGTQHSWAASSPHSHLNESGAGGADDTPARDNESAGPHRSVTTGALEVDASSSASNEAGLSSGRCRFGAYSASPMENSWKPKNMDCEEYRGTGLPLLRFDRRSRKACRVLRSPSTTETSARTCGECPATSSCCPFMFLWNKGKCPAFSGCRENRSRTSRARASA